MVGQGGKNTVGVEPTTRDGAKPRLAVRAFERSGGQRRLVVAAVIGCIAMNAGSTWLFAVAEQCGIVHLASQLAGSDERFSWLVQGCSVPATVQEILVPDFLLMFGYWLMFSAVLIGGWWRFEAPMLRRASWVLWLPTIVFVVDTIEYFLLITLLYKDNNGQFHLHGNGSVLNWAQVTVSWTKWVGVAAMVVAAIMAAGVWFSRRADPFPPVETPAPPRGTTQVLDGGQCSEYDDERSSLSAEHGQRVGICLSGGGIRSAAFCLGVLSQLEAGSPHQAEPPTKSARYLAAVSGGAWAATAWTLQKASQPAPAASDVVIAGLQADAEPAGYTRENYLMNGRGGVLGALGWMLLSTITNLLLLGLLVYLIAWPLGWAVSICVIDSGRLGPEQCGPPPIPADYLYVPSIVYAGLGLLWLGACGFMNRKGARTWPIGVVLLALSLFSAALLTWTPKLFALAHDWNSVAAGSAIGGTVFVSVVAGFWKLFGGPLLHEATGHLGRAIPRLLGILLLLGAIAWALVVMYAVAQSIAIHVSTPWGTLGIPMQRPVAFVIPAVVLLGMYALLGPNWPTLHNIFSARLRSSFDAVVSPFEPVVEADQAHPPALGSNTSDHDEELTPGTWAWLSTKTHVPELILCCAQQRNGISMGGLRAETFTISPHFVRQGGARSCETADYIDVARQIKRFPFGRQDCGRLEYVSAWLATTGAAFASAMGRMSLGSTNAFLAAVNADLGVWLPNVKVLQEQRGRVDRVPPRRESRGELVGLAKTLFPRPRFAYTLKEILGWYHVDDRYIFITDGGHWDNLGLVELLRRECNVIYCVDATGDPPGSFATLREALQLAALELDFDCSDTDLEECLNGLLPKADSLPATAATTFTLNPSHGPDGAHGTANKPVTVHYAKLQATQTMSAELKRWAIADPKFPRYSTLSQFLTDEQFKNLVELGQIAGADVLRCAEDVRQRQGGAPPTQPVDAVST
jgi:hypothetical protein